MTTITPMSEKKFKSLKIENIVASGSIADSIDLEVISTSIENCDLNKKRFPGAVYRIENPKIAILIFSSGKVVMTGVKTETDLALGLDILTQKMEEAGVVCYDEPKVVVTNMVCSYDTGNKINLVKVVMSLRLESIEYEPEVFPGLVYRIPDPKVVALLFSSGKLILTGGRNIEDVERGLAFLEQKISGI
jgi:transcription initiation factor TFIID TATA-box-binding protein